MEKLKKGIDYIGVCVVYFCHDGKGNFVMNKRTEKTRDEHGLWDIGGGGLEFGDSIEETIKKEINEEYCTEIINYEFLGYRDVHREKDGIKTHWVALDFKVEINPEKVKNGEPEKFENIGWFRLETLPKNIHSQLNKFLEIHFEKLFPEKRKQNNLTQRPYIKISKKTEVRDTA